MNYDLQKSPGPGDKDEGRGQFDRDITNLGGKINQFRIDVQRYFAGDLQLPPDDLCDKIRHELRRLMASKQGTSADTFRLNTLEAQFQSHVELYGRRMRDHDEGRDRPRADRPELRHDARQGVVLGTRPADGAVEALYKGLYLQGGPRKASMDLERFRQHLGKQAETIRAKTGCRDIQFRVTEEDGKMKIKAKPIKNKAAT